MPSSNLTLVFQSYLQRCLDGMFMGSSHTSKHKVFGRLGWKTHTKYHVILHIPYNCRHFWVDDFFPSKGGRILPVPCRVILPTKSPCNWCVSRLGEGILHWWRPGWFGVRPAACWRTWTNSFLFDKRPHVELVALLATCSQFGTWHTRLQDHLDNTVCLVSGLTGAYWGPLRCYLLSLRHLLGGRNQQSHVPCGLRRSGPLAVRRGHRQNIDLSFHWNSRMGVWQQQLEDRYMWEIPTPSTQWLDPAGDRQVAGYPIGSMFGIPFIRCQFDVNLGKP